MAKARSKASGSSSASTFRAVSTKRLWRSGSVNGGRFWGGFLDLAKAIVSFIAGRLHYAQRRTWSRERRFHTGQRNLGCLGCSRHRLLDRNAWNSQSRCGRHHNPLSASRGHAERVPARWYYHGVSFPRVPNRLSFRTRRLRVKFSPRPEKRDPLSFTFWAPVAATGFVRRRDFPPGRRLRSLREKQQGGKR